MAKIEEREPPSLRHRASILLRLVIILSIIFPIMYLMYLPIFERAIRWYNIAFEAFGAPIMYLLAILLVYAVIMTFLSPAIDILFGHIIWRFWRSTYFISHMKFYIYKLNNPFRVRFSSSEPVRRIKGKFISGPGTFLYSQLFIIIFLSYITVSITILRYTALYPGEIWSRSIFWNLTQLHLTTVGVGLTVLVFSLSSIENNMNRLEHGILIVRELLLVRIVIASTILSVYFFFSTLLIDLSDAVFSFLLVGNFLLYVLTLVSVLLMILKVFTIFLSHPQEEHLTGARAKIVSISMAEKRKQISSDILKRASSGISEDVTQAAVPYHEITADELGLEPGEHVTDIDKRIIKNALQRRGAIKSSINNRSFSAEEKVVHARFEITLGEQIETLSDPVLSIVSNVSEEQKHRIINEVSKAIQTEIFDPWFNQDSFDQSHGIIHHLIEDTEKKIKSSIDSRNVLSLKYNLSIYRRLMISILSSKSYYSINKLSNHPTEYIFNNLRLLFIYSMGTDNGNEKGVSQSSLEIIKVVYLIFYQSKRDYGRKIESEKAKNLLREFEEMVEVESTDQIDKINSLLREFE